MLKKFKIGHWTDEKNKTGVTAILAVDGAVGGCSIMGAAPATRETDLLHVDKTVQKINAVTLSGGSAFGLEAACGVMQWLSENGYGYDAGGYKVPIVVGASLYDLEYGDFAFPDKAAGFEAAKNAAESNFEGGNIGAGTGATVGKIFKMKCAMKGGFGVKTYDNDGLEIAVLSAVNALGDIIDESGAIIAGARLGKRSFIGSKKFYAAYEKFLKKQNTTISCIITNAVLSKEQANMLAEKAHEGYKSAISPSHTAFDGDAIFVMASGGKKVDFDLLLNLVPGLVADAVRAPFI